MHWIHKCSLTWLKARQLYLTATDVIKLLPLTKTGRKRDITNSNYLSVYASKCEVLYPDDVVSTGAAARGHILEPYAVDSINKLANEKMYHWDDRIITSLNSASMFPLAFSPDACNVPMPNSNLVVLDYADIDGLNKITEIKSYSTEKHMSKLFMDKKDIEERWQIAHAMAVSGSIQEADLCFFNPGIGKYQTILFSYDRNDLKEEIATVFDIGYKFNSFVKSFTRKKIKTTPTHIIDGDFRLEEIIMKDVLRDAELNGRLNPW